jgi:predicted nucleic acid-binding protein
MIFYALVRNIDLDVVKPLFRRIKEGDWQAFTSALTFDELSYRLLLALIGEQHEGNPLNHLRSNEEQMITTYYPKVANEVSRLQTFPGLIVLDVTLADLAAMHQLVVQHHLRPRDALHLAAMRKVGCLDLVSNDGDFDRVPGVQRLTLS